MYAVFRLFETHDCGRLFNSSQSEEPKETQRSLR